MSEFKVGATALPFLPWCRCCTAPYFADMEGVGRRFARDPDDEFTYTVPKDMTYKQWKTIQDGNVLDKSAESDIIKNIELPPETDAIRSMSSETKQLVSDAFDKVLAEYDVRIDEIVTMPLGDNDRNVPFQFRPVEGSRGEFIKKIVINSNYDFMGSQEEFQKRIMRNFSRKALASNSIDGLIAHEMAHVMTFQDVSTFSGYLLENKTVAKCEAYGISKYADASLDGAEHIAEAFAAKRCGLQISKEAQALLDKYVERWRR